LTSEDRKRKIISSSEIIDQQGVHSVIHRHFVCLVKEIADNQLEKPLPYLRVLKEHNKREQKEKFFYKIKGSIYAVKNGRLFLILYMHSLRISLTALSQNASYS
jgi:hypothetical protein